MIERHIEKIVLAVCVVLLVIFAWMYLPSSPREIPVVVDARGTKDTLPPQEADKALQEAARAIEREIRQAKPDVYTTPNYLSQIVDRASNPLPAMDPLMDFGQPRAPLPGGTDEGPQNKVTLAQMLGVMPEPSRPLVRVEREYARKVPEPSDVLSSHIAATYPWEELSKKWQQELNDTRIRASIIAVGVEVEVRELKSDGSWSEPRLVETARLPLQDRDGSQLVIPSLTDYDGTNADMIIQTTQKLAELQQEILEPTWWDIWWSDSRWGDWKVNLPDNPVSEKAPPGTTSGAGGYTTAAPQGSPDAPEEPGMAPGGPMGPGAPGMPMGPGAAPGMPMGPVAPAGPAGPSGPKPAAATPKPARERPVRRAAAGRNPGGMGGGPMGPGGLGGPGGPGGPGAPPEPRVRTKREPVQRAVPVMPAAAASEMPQPKAVPPLAQQIQDGTVLLWSHDTTIEPLKTYQYRVRLVLVNPLITFIEDVVDEKDAGVAVVRTQFSRWSNPVNVPQETEFFVTGHEQSMEIVYAQVFTRRQGQVVSERFKIKEGEAIGETKTVRVTDPASGAKESLPVDFTTGAVAVRFDFDKKILKGSVPRSTVEMVYLSENGELRTRVRSVDEDSERYRQLKEEADRAKAVAASDATSMR